MTEPQSSAEPGRPDDRMAGLKGRLRDTPVLSGWRFARSLIDAVRWRGALHDVRTYCLFVGHGRSGHSIVGSLIDAHPEAIVSDELDALRYLALGFRRDQVLALSIARSARQAAGMRRKAGRGGKTYSYLVPGWWNGRYDRLTVVGDTRAGGTVHRLTADPDLFGEIDRRMRGLVVRYVHVVRNPFDNISTMTVRRGREPDEAIDAYLADCHALVELRGRIETARLHTLRHEDLVTGPAAAISGLCEFLGLAIPEGYLEACAGILFASPSRSREAVDWTPEQIARVTRGIDEIDFLAGYSFDA